MSALWQIVLAFGGLIAAFVCVVVIMAIRWEWKLRHMPPRPPFRCPACDSDEIDIRSSGLWDGFEVDGQPTGGSYEYGLCKQCGGRCSWTNGRPHIPSEEEWKSAVEPTERMQREQKSWPFKPDDQQKLN